MYFDIKIPKNQQSSRVDLLSDLFAPVGSFQLRNSDEINYSDLRPVGSPIHPESFVKTIWVADICGLDPKYGFKRTFLKRKIIDTDITQIVRFEVLESKYYEFRNVETRGFFLVKNEKIKPMTKHSIKNVFSSLKEEKKETINKLVFISRL